MAKVLGLPVGDPRVKRAALGSWSNYGRTASHLLSLPYMNMVDIDARTQDLTRGMTWQECTRLAMTPGRGAILTTGHFGSWDLAGAIFARHFPLSAIADTFKDARLNALIQGHRREKSVGIIPAEGAVRRVLQELHQNRAVAIVMDRPVTIKQGVEVTFFGHTTYVPGGSAALALKTGASVLPGYVWYAPNNRYYIRAFPPMLPRPVNTTSEKVREIQRLTQYMCACQEEVVREWPTQWFMFRPFWPTEAEAAVAKAAEAAAA